MFSERMQLLLTPEQRRRLEAEARERRTSVSAIVREAIDARVPAVSRKRRIAALERLERMPVIPFIPIDELNALIDTRYDDLPK